MVQENCMQYKNPIISGYNPDPTICRVGEDYYILNSSFEYFPGVPIYHSRNLANWELQGYVLTSKRQLDLDKVAPSQGIYAPTLRYHDGYFFMCTTNVGKKGNFIVYSRDILHGWSDPVWVEQDGIDPSILFDDDGKVYFCTAVFDPGKEGIYICELNPFTGEKYTQTKLLTKGCGGKYAEGPHLYKWFGKYYLMMAEGGTEYGHMETIMRSDNPYGPYEPCPHNPIITHRNDMKEDIMCTGHADMMEDANGNWWMVCLGIRPITNENRRVLLHNLGRETFLAPVHWENGWPVVGMTGKEGMLELEMKGPLPGKPEKVNRDFFDDFSRSQFKLDYNFLRNPEEKNYQLCPKDKCLRLRGSKVTLSMEESPTFVGIRQKEFQVSAEVKVRLDAKNQGARAGLTAYYNKSFHYDISVTQKKNGLCIVLGKQLFDVQADVTEKNIEENTWILLKMVTDKEFYRFYYSLNGQDYTYLGQGLTAGLCTEITETMTFTGVYIGMFAENGEAEFQDFSVRIL